MKRVLIGVMFLALFCVAAFAQTDPVVPVTEPVVTEPVTPAVEPATEPVVAPAVVDIPGTINAIPNLKEGVMYDLDSNRALNFLAFEVLGYKNFALNGGLVDVDGIGAAITYNLVGLQSFGITTPILDYLKYVNVGWGASYRHLTGESYEGGDPDGDNQFSQGPVIFASIKF